MTDIIIIGGGGHAGSVLEVLFNHPDYSVRGYVDHSPTKAMSKLPIDYLGTDDDLPDLLTTSPYVALGLGQIKSPHLRIDFGQKLALLGAKSPSIISPKATVSSFSKIQDGSIIFHNSLINTDCKIGKFNIINSATVIEHGVTTEDFVHIAPRAIVLGDAFIGYGSFIGAGAIIREGVSVASHCIIGAGVTVMHDVPKNSIIKA